METPPDPCCMRLISSYTERHPARRSLWASAGRLIPLVGLYETLPVFASIFRVLLAGLLVAMASTSATAQDGRATGEESNDEQPERSSDDRDESQDNGLKDEQSAAKILFNQGLEFFANKQYEAACARFEASLQYWRGIGSLGKLAECYEKLGKVASAWRLYREAASQAGRRGDSARQTIAAGRAAALEARLPHLTVVLTEPESAGQIIQMTIKRDDTVLTGAELGSAVPVDPGAHVVTASARGYKTWSTEVSLTEKQYVTVTVPILRAPRRSPWRVVGMSTFGVGVATALAGGFFGVRSIQQWNQAFDDALCVEFPGDGTSDATRVCNARGFDLVDDANSNATRANILIAAGLVTATAGLVVWLSAKPHGASGDERRAHIIPVAGHESVGLVVSGSF